MIFNTFFTSKQQNLLKPQQRERAQHNDISDDNAKQVPTTLELFQNAFCDWSLATGNVSSDSFPHFRDKDYVLMLVLV